MHVVSERGKRTIADTSSGVPGSTAQADVFTEFGTPIHGGMISIYTNCNVPPTYNTASYR